MSRHRLLPNPAIHGGLAYYGWNWISSMQAPAVPNAPEPTMAPAIAEPMPMHRARADYSGKMQWTRSEGLTINPDNRSSVKCIGNVPYTTRKSADGSTVIEILTFNGKPATCKNDN